MLSTFKHFKQNKLQLKQIKIYMQDFLYLDTGNIFLSFDYYIMIYFFIRNMKDYTDFVQHILILFVTW